VGEQAKPQFPVITPLYGQLSPLKLGGSVPVPKRISGLQLWLDASDASTLFDATSGGSIVTTDGNSVARWADKSGNNKHLTQATANARPILKTGIKNGKSILRFDGANDTMSSVLSVNNPMTFVFVSYPVSDTVGYRVLFAGNNNGIAIGYDSSSRVFLYTSTGSQIARTKPTNFELYVGIFNGANSRLIVNNNFDYSWGTTATNLASLNLTTNMSNFYRNDFAEFLIYDSVLSNNNINILKEYLNAKWAIY
jgi:hypothetical protein